LFVRQASQLETNVFFAGVPCRVWHAKNDKEDMAESQNQADVDALLNSIQDQANSLAADAAGAAAAATPADAAAIAQVAGSMDEIAGEIDAPPPKVPGAPDAAALAGEFDAPAATTKGGDISRLLSIEVPVIVLLGQRRMTVGEVMRLGVGAIVEFQKSAEEELDLLVNNKPIGRGHAVKVGENFGIKLAGVGDIRDTIKKLGAA
jgi:flagellar motor switch protein FliN/FliY